MVELDVVRFVSDRRWCWVLREDGAVLAEHEVRIDSAEWEYEAFGDLYAYLGLHAARDARAIVKTCG